MERLIKIFVSLWFFVGVVSLNANALDRGASISGSIGQERLIEQKKAQTLGVDLRTYRKLGLIAKGTNNFSMYKDAVNLQKHPAIIQLNQITYASDAIPNSLQDELSNLILSNYQVVADELGVERDELLQLLVGYIKLNSQDLETQNPKEHRKLTNVDTFRATTDDNDDDDDDDEDESEPQHIEIIIVTASQRNSIKNGGHARMFNRLHRNATNRWGMSGRGTTIAVFAGESFTMTREYSYVNGVTTANHNSFTCMGQCVATISPF